MLSRMRVRLSIVRHILLATQLLTQRSRSSWTLQMVYTSRAGSSSKRQASARRSVGSSTEQAVRMAVLRWEMGDPRPLGLSLVSQGFYAVDKQQKARK